MNLQTAVEYEARLLSEVSNGTNGSRRGRLWATPRASEYKGCGPLDGLAHRYRLKKGYLDAQVQEAERETGMLSADWVEMLMDVPQGWTRIEPYA